MGILMAWLQNQSRIKNPSSRFTVIGHVSKGAWVPSGIAWRWAFCSPRNLLKTMNNKTGLIQIPILIGIIISLTIGTIGYVEIKKYSAHQLEAERQVNMRIAAKQKELDEMKSQAEILKVSSTQNSDKSGKDINPSVRIIERIIEKPVIVEKLVERTTSSNSATLPAAVALSPTPTSTFSPEEKNGFNTYWTNYAKFSNELKSASTFYSDSINGISQPPLALTYAQNAVDSCNSAYQVNLNNSVPSLPFANTMWELTQISSKLANKCREWMQAYKQSVQYLADGNPYAAKDSQLQAIKFLDEYFAISKNELKPKENEVSKKANEFFK